MRPRNPCLGPGGRGDPKVFAGGAAGLPCESEVAINGDTEDLLEDLGWAF